MPISSYPRITLGATNINNNPQSGTGLSIYDYDNDQYTIADSNLFPINLGGLASEGTLSNVLENTAASGYDGSSIGNTNYEIKRNTEKQIGATVFSISDLLVSVTNDATAADMLYTINESLLTIVSLLQNGTGAIQIKGSNGNLAHVSAANRINVVL